MSKLVFAILMSTIGLQANSADTTPILQGSIFGLYKDGTQKLLKSHDFYMEETAVVMLQTSSNKVYCKVGTLLSSSSQPYKGIQCSLYDNESNHIGWAFNAYYPWILDHPAENKIQDSKGRDYLIRFEAIPKNELAKTSGLGEQIKYWECNFAKSPDNIHWLSISQSQLRIFDEFGPNTKRTASLKDSVSGLTAICNSKTTGSGSRTYQELNCAIEDLSGNQIVKKSLLMGDSLVVDLDQSDYFYTVLCEKKAKAI